MKQEFCTQYGKVENERNVLYIRNWYAPFSQTAFVELGTEIFWIISFGLIVGFPDENPAKNKLRLLFWGVLVTSRLPVMYRKFVKRSWASRIPLSRIRSFSVEPDHLNLVTTVNLHLANGRVRPILFRTNEAALQEFTTLLAASQPALATT